MKTVKAQEAIRVAYQKGYRVVDGEVHVTKKLKLQTQKGYKRFNVPLEGKKTFPVLVHRLLAFQKFGEGAFQPGMQARHLDGQSLNNSDDNIIMGTAHENSMDRPEQARKEHAAKCAQKHSDVLIAEIRHDHQSGLGYKKLRAKYGLPLSTLSYYLSDTAKRTTFTFKTEA